MRLFFSFRPLCPASSSSVGGKTKPFDWVSSASAIIIFRQFFFLFLPHSNHVVTWILVHPSSEGGSRNRKVLATRHRHRCFSRLDDSGHSRGYTRTLRTTRPCCLSPATHNCYNVRLFPKSTTNAARAAGQTDDTNISPHNIEAGCLKTGFGSVCCSTCLWALCQVILQIKTQSYSSSSSSSFFFVICFFHPLSVPGCPFISGDGLATWLTSPTLHRKPHGMTADV